MWNNLEHKIWNSLKKNNLENKSIYLLAVSAGLDSMALISLLKKVKPFSKLVLMHYHHGFGDNQIFRDNCLALIKKTSLADDQFVLEFEVSDQVLKSEAELRNARLDFFDKIKEKHQVNFYLTAHHQDDVLETRLIKLIRGAGAASLKAFEEWNNSIYRPFYEIQKNELKKYAESCGLIWIEDPTNSESNYLRNWIRNDWLPALDLKMAGSVSNLSQSLQNILNESAFGADLIQSEIERAVVFGMQEAKIDRLWFLSFNTKDQLLILVRVLRRIPCNSEKSDFSTNQLKEVLHRLDKNQNEHIFQVAGINWVINTGYIVLSYNQKTRDGSKHES